MATSARVHMSRLLLGNKRRVRGAVMFACLAAFVALGVVAILRQRGIAASTSRRVLDCPIQGVVAHTHDESCYDADGNLVCTLPERELHVHGDSCYEETRELACGLEESEGHVHSDACYDADGNLVCGLEESEGHVHSDACYEVVRTLTCDKEEVAEEHVHGPGCFRTVAPQDGEAVTAFRQEFEDADKNIVLAVDVTAPEGALPDGATMRAEWVDEDQIDRTLVQRAVDEGAAKKGEAAGKLLKLQAVQIRFYDPEGEEVVPTEDVMVAFTSELADGTETARIVAVESEQEAQERVLKAQESEELVNEEEAESTEQADTTEQNVEAEPTAIELDQLNNETLALRDVSSDGDQIAVDTSGEPSTYVLATTTSAIEMQSESDTARVTVIAQAEAGIPQGSTVQVVEYTQDTPEYESYEASALAAMEVADAELARFFDITILDPEGNEVQPQAPVSVKIKLADAPIDGEQPAVVHFAETAEEGAASAEPMPELIPAEVNKRTTTFEAESFSVYGVVYTVDFHYEVDGKVYEFSMAGEDAVSLRELVKTLHIADTYMTRNSTGLEKEVSTEESIAKFMADIERVEFSDSSLLAVLQVEKKTTLGELNVKNGIVQRFTLTASEEEVKSRNAKQFDAGDWALVSLLPFDTKEQLTITLTNGSAVTIEVTDAQDATMNSDGTVQTVANPSGTIIDLFDYWIADDLKDETGRAAWPGGWTGNWSWNEHTSSGGADLSGTGNNAGINASTEDTEHGHALKFSPAFERTVVNGSKNGWGSQNVNGTNGLNSYTGNGNPFRDATSGTDEGIVDYKLDANGYPQLTDNGTIGSTGESLQYLFDTEYDHAGKQSYPNADQLLYVDKNGYYTYDSRDYAAAFDGSTFTLTEQTSGDGEVRGFWPFGTQKYWMGMHINTQFSMPANGQVLNPAGQYRDMQFEFSGDDDTWLYVDGVLVGDGGGIHNRTEIDINFATGLVTVTGKNAGEHAGTYEVTRCLDDIFIAAGRYVEDDWEEIPGSTHKRFKAGTYHTFDMFYLERGGGESNLYIHYNLVSTADFTAHKEYHGEEIGDVLSRDQFKFDLIGLDGRYDTSGQLIAGLENEPAIMPAGGSSDGAGTVLSPYYNGDISVPLTGDTYHAQQYRTGNTEDGNINFGSAEISEAIMAAYDANPTNPPIYRYVVREVVPDDAVNASGVMWANATNEQKLAGGFVKDNVIYDGHISYMTAAVTKWAVTDSNGNQKVDAHGNPVYQYGLSKRYWTDDTFTEQADENHRFINFDNRFVRPITMNVIKKNEEDELLPGATFTLSRASQEDGKWAATPNTAMTATSDDQGSLSFEGLTQGYYILEETEAPDGYRVSDSKWLVTLTRADREATVDTHDGPEVYILSHLDATVTELNAVGSPAGEAVAQELVDHAFSKEIVNEKARITVKKKWLDADGNDLADHPESIDFTVYQLRCEHEWGDWVIDKAATEDEEGLRHRECVYDSSHVHTEVIPTLDHDHTRWLEHVDAADPTCTESGNREHWRCTRDGYLFADEGAAQELQVEDVYLAPLGHDYVVTVTTEPTCEADGMGTHTCSRCGDSYTEVIPAIGHDWQETDRQEPTVSQDGWVDYVCSHDSSHTKHEVIPATGVEGYIKLTVSATQSPLPPSDFGYYWALTVSQVVKYDAANGTVVGDPISYYLGDLNYNNCENTSRTTGEFTDKDASGKAVKVALQLSGTDNLNLNGVTGGVYGTLMEATGMVIEGTVQINGQTYLLVTVTSNNPTLTIHVHQAAGSGTNSASGASTLSTGGQGRKLSALPRATLLSGSKANALLGATAQMVDLTLAGLLERLGLTALDAASTDTGACLSAYGTPVTMPTLDDGTNKETVGDITVWNTEMPIDVKDEYGVPYTYYVVETDPAVGGDYTVTYEGQESGVADEGVVTITNQTTPREQEVTFLKTNEDGTENLGGVTFKLTKLNASTGEYEKFENDGFAVDATNENKKTGPFEITEALKDMGITLTLEPGSYQLTEVEAPAGYIIEDGTWEFEIARDGTMTGDDVVDGSTMKITIPNTPGHELPAAGGPGTIAIYALGLGMFAATGLLLLKQRA